VARAAVLGRLTWRIGTVVALLDETPAVRTIVLEVPEWPGHRAGQHLDVRLTAEDGYQAERSYSIASAPESDRMELTVERLDHGEVSPYLVGELREGDQLELRGPIGGYFVWDGDEEAPLQLVAGGSGVVPLMCMVRHRARHRRRDLQGRARADGGDRRQLRVDQVTWAAAGRPIAFVCGPTPLVESVARDLVQLGHEPGRVKTERFGPTGR
jgi:ferredoxin-NADP reductase